MITLQNVTKIYTSGENKIYGIKNINLTIEDGEFVAIVGPSGCGKSTLLNIIGGIDTASSGEVIVNNIALQTLSDKALTKFRKEQIGFVFQFFNLLSTLTARENVELSLSLRGIKGKKAKKEAQQYLALVGIPELENRFPSELSGGQQQRVAIARGLAKKAPIVLTDEPTGNIDSKSGQEVITSLIQAAQKTNTTVLMVTHDKSIAQRADRILTLKDGKIISDSKQ